MDTFSDTYLFDTIEQLGGNQYFDMGSTDSGCDYSHEPCLSNSELGLEQYNLMQAMWPKEQDMCTDHKMTINTTPEEHSTAVHNSPKLLTDRKRKESHNRSKFNVYKNGIYIYIYT